MKKQGLKSVISESFSNSFPPPKFLDIRVTGVDISDSSVKILGFKNTQKSNIPFFCEEQRISNNIVNQGGIEDIKALSKILTSLRIKYNMKFVRVSLPEEKAYLFDTTVSNSKDKKQTSNSVEFKLEEYVPISVEESVFDYDVIKESHGSVDVSVTVFPKTVIANYQKVFELSGLTPVSFVIEGQAIANAVIARSDSKTYMIVDFGRDRSGISIIRNGIVSYTATIDVGGNDLTEVIKKHFKVDDIGARKIKNKKGFINKKENEELYNSLTTTVSSLKNEINRHFTYWNNKDTNQKKEDKINKIILCGGNASLYMLPESLSVDIKIPVERAQVWQNAFSYNDFIPEMSYEKSLSYATVIGLALT